MAMRRYNMGDPALAAIASDASAACGARLARVAGTHGLLLDGTRLPTPAVTGVGCWTHLWSQPDGARWRGSLNAAVEELPFADGSFCALLVRFVSMDALVPEAAAVEFARVLAAHGVLLIADLHPRSLWLAGTAPGRWERALRGAGLDVTRAVRCGAPWPRARGARGVPRWLVRGMGGAWVVKARQPAQAAIPLRKAAVNRRAVEQSALVPGGGTHRRPLRNPSGAAACVAPGSMGAKPPRRRHAARPLPRSMPRKLASLAAVFQGLDR